MPLFPRLAQRRRERGEKILAKMSDSDGLQCKAAPLEGRPHWPIHSLRKTPLGRYVQTAAIIVAVTIGGGAGVRAVGGSRRGTGAAGGGTG